jgi:hypothetical protein
LNRSRQTTTTTTTAAPVQEDTIEEEEVKTQLEFEGSDEVTKVGFKDGNSLRRQVVGQVDSETDEQLPPQDTTTTTEIPQETATPSDEPSSSSPSGFILTQPLSSTTEKQPDRVYVVNALSSTDAPTTDSNTVLTTLEVAATEPPTDAPTTLSDDLTNTVTSIVTSITESSVIGRTKIIINKKQFILLPKPTTQMPPTTKAEKESEEEVNTTEAQPSSTSQSTTTKTEGRVRGTTIRFKRPPYVPKQQEDKFTSLRSKEIFRKRQKVEKPTEEPEIVHEDASSKKPGFTRKRISFSTTTTETPSSTTRRPFKPSNRGRITFSSAEDESAADEVSSVSTSPRSYVRSTVRRRTLFSTTALPFELSELEDTSASTSPRSYVRSTIRRRPVVSTTAASYDETSEVPEEDDVFSSTTAKPYVRSTVRRRPVFRTTDDTVSSEETSRRPVSRRRFYTSEATSSAELSTRRPTRLVERRRRPTTSTTSTTEAPISVEEFSQETFEPIVPTTEFPFARDDVEVPPPNRRRTVLVIKGRPSSTTIQPAEPQYDPYGSVGQDEFFLLSSTHSGPDSSVEEENVIGAQDDEVELLARSFS